MRIAIVSRIYWPEPSAASSFLASVARELYIRDAEVTVVTTQTRSPAPDHLRAEHIRRWPVLRDSSGYVRGYLQYASFDAPLVLRLLTMKRPDVVFVEPPPTTGAIVRIICALRRIPYVYDVADLWADAAVNATSSRLVIRVLRRIERFALSGASALVTISQHVADRIANIGIRVPVSVTGFGAETDALSYHSSANVEPSFVYGGTFSEIHGASVFIHAFARFRQSHPQYSLTFIGNGTERDSLERLAEELRIRDSVRFLRPVDPHALAEHLNRATASLASLAPDSHYEYAMTTKAFSSLACGCPVIFAGPGPTRELLESAPRPLTAGFAVDYDVDSVEAAMRHMAEEPLSATQRAELAKWTHAQHSLGGVAARVADVISANARKRG